jgi:multiple antibiotic resistance protein
MIWSDFGQLTGAILLMVGAVLPVVNPLGDAPIFLAMTPGCDELTRADLAKRIAFYSFILLLGSMLLGSFVLRLFGLSLPVVQVAGGAVVCALGWKLLAENPKPADVTIDLVHANLMALGRAFSPLTMPLTIDAGVISVAITVGANHAHTFEHGTASRRCSHKSASRVEEGENDVVKCLPGLWNRLFNLQFALVQ